MGAVTDLDPKTLERVRKLLAKAEHPATPPAEAEVFSSKASALMARYAIDHAVLEASSHARSDPQARQVQVEPPYAMPRAVLLDRVARAHRVRVVIGPEAPRGARVCTLVGFPVDLDVVEVLFTSLLLQASTAMLMASEGHPRQKAFRRAFLIGYAEAIGARLAAATAQTDVEAEVSAPGTSMVLADRRAQVDSEFERRYPHLRRMRMSVSSGSGVTAGRAAGARADLMSGTTVSAQRPRRLA